METNGHKKCEWTDDLIAYLYNEMPAAGRSTFESHLTACQTCTDEFAGLSQARFEVFDWKREEFDTLATPASAIAYPESRPSLRERSISPRKAASDLASRASSRCPTRTR